MTNPVYRILLFIIGAVEDSSFVEKVRRVNTLLFSVIALLTATGSREYGLVLSIFWYGLFGLGALAYPFTRIYWRKDDLPVGAMFVVVLLTFLGSLALLFFAPISHNTLQAWAVICTTQAFSDVHPIYFALMVVSYGVSACVALYINYGNIPYIYYSYTISNTFFPGAICAYTLWSYKYELDKTQKSLESMQSLREALINGINIDEALEKCDIPAHPDIAASLRQTVNLIGEMKTMIPTWSMQEVDEEDEEDAPRNPLTSGEFVGGSMIIGANASTLANANASTLFNANIGTGANLVMTNSANSARTSVVNTNSARTSVVNANVMTNVMTNVNVESTTAVEPISNAYGSRQNSQRGSQKSSHRGSTPLKKNSTEVLNAPSGGFVIKANMRTDPAAISNYVVVLAKVINFEGLIAPIEASGGVVHLILGNILMATWNGAKYTSNKYTKSVTAIIALQKTGQLGVAVAGELRGKAFMADAIFQSGVENGYSLLPLFRILGVATEGCCLQLLEFRAFRTDWDVGAGGYEDGVAWLRIYGAPEAKAADEWLYEMEQHSPAMKTIPFLEKIVTNGVLGDLTTLDNAHPATMVIRKLVERQTPNVYIVKI